MLGERTTCVAGGGGGDTNSVCQPNAPAQQHLPYHKGALLGGC